jgi:hypothetical protein
MPLAVLFLLSLFPGCSSDSKPSDSAESEEAGVQLEPPAEGEGFQFSFSTTVPAYSEAWLCSVYDFPIEEASSVSWVEYSVTKGMHHMTLSTPGLTGGVIEPGLYDCDDLYSDSDLMGNQIMFFGLGSGDETGTMNLPDGVAANFIPGLDVIHEMHYVNTLGEEVELVSKVNAYTMPAEDVVDGIWGGQVRDEHIEIAANSEHSEWTRCTFNEDVEVHFLASHMHGKGIKFTIREFDGESAGEIFYTATDWHDPLITQYDPPLVIPAGTGFEYECTWNNGTDEPVLYGLTSEDEMCNMSIVHTPQSMTASCGVVESSDGYLWEG